MGNNKQREPAVTDLWFEIEWESSVGWSAVPQRFPTTDEAFEVVRTMPRGLRTRVVEVRRTPVRSANVPQSPRPEGSATLYG